MKEGDLSAIRTHSDLNERAYFTVYALDSGPLAAHALGRCGLVSDTLKLLLAASVARLP
jgi:hypothetical protein